MATLLSINNYHYYRGGAETVFFAHNKLLQDAGWRVVPFSMQHENNIPSEYEKYFVSEIEYGREYSIRRKIANAQKAIYSFEARRKIGDLVRHTKPNIAHAHNVYHHLSPAIFSELRKLGIPTVLTLHDLKIACPAYKMRSAAGICERCKTGGIKSVVTHRCIKDSLLLSSIIFVEAALHRFLGSYTHAVDRFVVPSRFHLEKFVEWGWPRDKFVYIPNFIDAAPLIAAAGNCGVAFAYVGRLVEEKGVRTFIRAVASAGVEGWIVGTGPDEAYLRALAISERARITFFGHRSAGAVSELIRNARAIVIPSELYENAPLALLESYACGIPVIGAVIGGIPEMVEESLTGLLFKSGDADSLAGCLRQLMNLTDADLREMGRQGHQLVTRRFGSRQYLDRVLDLYRSLGVGDDKEN